MMTLYKDTKAMSRSLDDDTNFFDIVAGVLLGGTFAPFLLIIYLDYVLQMSVDLMKENDFTFWKKARSRRYQIETVMSTDYADDQALLATTPVQAECRCIAWNRQQEAFVFTWTQIKHRSYVLNKMVLSLD